MGTLRQQTLFALRYAVRAPSTHNTQPWLFHIEGNILRIYADWSRALPEGDKDRRDICISLGACVQYAKTALSYFGMLEELTIAKSWEIGSKEPIATLTLRLSKDRDVALLPLVQAIEYRFNARGPFFHKPIPNELYRTLLEITEPDVTTSAITDETQLLTFASLTGEGMKIAHHDSKFRAELAGWMTSNYSKRKDGIPGYSMLAPGLLSLILPTLIGKFNMGEILSKLNHHSISSSSGVLIFSSKDSPNNWVHVGMTFARISLLLNVSNVFTSVYVASIEMPEIRLQLKEKMHIEGNPQFACVFGYPKIHLKQSPRITPENRML